MKHMLPISVHLWWGVLSYVRLYIHDLLAQIVSQKWI